MDYPRISIVIPAYNVAPYVEEALESVLHQTVAPLEVLVFNDGSTDGTTKILESYADHELVRYFSHENKGQGPVRNRGAELARGDYVYFFDADDLLDASFVERMQRLIVRDDAPDLIMFSGRPFVQAGFSPPISFDYERKFEVLEIDGEQALIRLHHAHCLYAQVCLYLVRRQYWLHTGLQFPANYHQDEDVLFPLVRGADRVTVVRDVFFFRRVRPNSTMTMAKTQRHVAARRRNVVYALAQLQSVTSSNRKLRKVARERCVAMTYCYVEIAGAAGRWQDVGLFARAMWLVRRSSMRRLALARFFGTGE